MIDGMLVDDGHTHIGDFRVVRNGVRCWTAEDLVARMDRSGADMSVVCHLEANLTKLRVAEEVHGLTREEKRRIVGETAASVFRLG